MPELRKNKPVRKMNTLFITERKTLLLGTVENELDA